MNLYYHIYLSTSIADKPDLIPRVRRRSHDTVTWRCPAVVIVNSELCEAQPSPNLVPLHDTRTDQTSNFHLIFLIHAINHDFTKRNETDISTSQYLKESNEDISTTSESCIGNKIKTLLQTLQRSLELACSSLFNHA